MSVHALALSPTHTFSKTPSPSLTLLTNIGISGDVHAGTHVQHRARTSHSQPPRPNLRQVHLLEKEVLDAEGVKPAEMGENVTTVGIDLVGLGRGTRLHFLREGEEKEGEGHAVVVVQGLRNPCWQIDKFRKGLKERFVRRDGERRIVKRLAGVLGTVERGGMVAGGMRIVVEEVEEFVALEVV